MKKNLILSRYSERVSWVNNLKDVDVFIYNKGEKLKDIYANIHNMPNIGREPYSYLCHLIENYDNLAPINIFSQADPFDHFKGVFEILAKDSLEDMYQEFLRQNEGMEGVRYDDYVGFGERNCASSFHFRSKMMGDFFGQFCRGDILPYSKGAIFAISDKKLRIRSRAYYLDLLNWMVDRFGTIGPKDKWEDSELDWWWPPYCTNSIWWPIGHILELMWPTIFNLSSQEIMF